MIERKYHGKAITSKPNDGFVQGSDGWTHTVEGKEFPTLGLAMAHAKNPPKKQKPKSEK